VFEEPQLKISTVLQLVSQQRASASACATQLIPITPMHMQALIASHTREQVQPGVSGKAEKSKTSCIILLFAELWSSQSILVAQGCGERDLQGQDKTCLSVPMVLKCSVSKHVLE